MPRSKIVFANLDDGGIREVLLACPTFAQVLAPAAHIGVGELALGRPRALRAVRSAVAGADAKRMGRWIQPLMHDVLRRFPPDLRHGWQTASNGVHQAVVDHLRQAEPLEVGMLFLAGVVDSGTPGGEAIEEHWDEIIATMANLAHSREETGVPDSGGPLEDLLIHVREVRTDGVVVAQLLREAAEAVSTGRLTVESLAEAVDWFGRACKVMGEVTTLVGTGPTSLDDAESALVHRLEALRAQETRKRHAEKARMREDEGRRVLLDAAKRLRQLGLDDQADDVLARLGDGAAAEGDDQSQVGRIRTGIAELSVELPVEELDSGRDERLARALASVETADAVKAPERRPVPSTDGTDADATDTDRAEEIISPCAAEEIRVLPDAPVDGSAEGQPELESEVASVADETAGLTVLASPWDVGDPPRIVSLLVEREYGLAWLLAKAAGESKLRQRALRFFAAAMNCDPSDLAAKQVSIAPDEDDLNAASADEARVLLAACLRFGLTAGYSPVGLHRLVDRADVESEPCHELIDTAVQTVHRGRVRPTGDDASFPQMLGSWSGLAAKAEELRHALLSRNISYRRASLILRYLVKEGNELGAALTHIAQLADAGPPPNGTPDERINCLQRLALQLHDRSKVRNLIDRADARVSIRSQLRNPIEANARTRLEESIDEVREFLDDAMGLYTAIRQVGRSTDLSQMDAMRRAAGRYQPPTEARTVGSAALHHLALWIAEEPARIGTDAVDALEQDATRLVYELDRDAYGRPMQDPKLSQLQGVLSGRTLDEAVLGHLDRGNLALAQQLLDESPASPHSAHLRQVCQQVKRDLKHRHNQTVAEVEAAIAKLRSVGRDDTAHRLEEELEGLRSDPANRFDLITGPLQSVLQEAGAKLAEYREELRTRINDVSPSTGDAARITGLLDDGDEVTAEEFAALLRAGQPLPEAGVEPTDDDFTAFFPRVVEIATEVAAELSDSKDDVIAQLEARLGNGQHAKSEIIRDGVQSWRTLRQLKISNVQAPHLRRVVGDVLRMLGLVPAEGNYLHTLSEAPRTRSALFQIRAKPAGRSYVPQFGTQANGRYNVAIMWERATPGRLLSLLPDRLRTGPNIILYFGALPAQQRLQLRSLSSPGRDTSSTVLLVDEAVIGWLASREEPDFRLTQRITLPFSSINPYTPFAGGDVPDEVFVGRDQERAELESPTGSMFVYGGRQLGKSALLRRVEKLFTEDITRASTGRRVALYLDLKSEGIGEAHEPKELWSLLNRHLKVLGVLPTGVAANAGPQIVADGIKRWLDKDQANRLLLLLDEADMFLTADFAAKEADRGARFQTLQRLKNLMESSNRRFKPVFAGLHQVQRFHDSANTPVAHGGADVLIGPLRAAEVRKLVVEPLRAIGYEFARSDLVWRVAAFTNYQASLVQIFCEALVSHLRERPLSSSGGRVQITSHDIDAVYTNRDVRNLIAQRFRWTINLDNRYRVIAIVVALLSNESPAGSRFDPEDLREYCEAYWAEAFASDVLTRKEFIRYLDEMVGLGVLRRTGDTYGMRSPNVVAMLGAPSALDQELREASVHFELPYEYNPTMSRVPLPNTVKHRLRRSPLTDADIADLIGERSDHPVGKSQVLRVGAHYSTALVTGSPALGIDRVVDALTIAAATRGLIFEKIVLHDVPRLLVGTTSGRHRFLLVECPPGRSEQFAADCAQAVRAVAAVRTVRAIVVVDLAQYSLTEELEDVEGLLRLGLRRWSAEGLRAWHDFPFDNPNERRRLHDLTSGWPALVENAARLATEGRSTGDVLDSLGMPFADSAHAASFLRDTGLSESVAETVLWAQYCANVDPFTHRVKVEPVTRDDLEAIWNHDSDSLLNRMFSLDVVEQNPDGNGWALDPIVAMAALRADGEEING